MPFYTFNENTRGNNYIIDNCSKKSQRKASGNPGNEMYRLQLTATPTIIKRPGKLNIIQSIYFWISLGFLRTFFSKPNFLFKAEILINTCDLQILAGLNICIASCHFAISKISEFFAGLRPIQDKYINWLVGCSAPPPFRIIFLFLSPAK